MEDDLLQLSSELERVGNESILRQHKLKLTLRAMFGVSIVLGAACAPLARWNSAVIYRTWRMTHRAEARRVELALYSCAAASALVAIVAAASASRGSSMRAEKARGAMCDAAAFRALAVRQRLLLGEASDTIVPELAEVLSAKMVLEL